MSAAGETEKSTYMACSRVQKKSRQEKKIRVKGTNTGALRLREKRSIPEES